ncbi:hypothetical protein PVK06_039642 [Gossypium arboreum]|uniref:Uncharacterized protein n=1 Tax=Gossypium arboreum TaxID=29729 RepID=A0ABR0N3E6_GOSAR|nr:hypothetical protein PVK06_039642 [Gossypium arboreum]
MKRLAVGLMTTPKYEGWLHRRINDNISQPSLGDVKSMDEYLQVIPSELEIIKADQWEKRFHDARARESALRKSLIEGQDERQILGARVAELERVLHQSRGHNLDIELRASLSRIEDLKGRVEELETALQNCEHRIEFLESNNE